VPNSLDRPGEGDGTSDERVSSAAPLKSWNARNPRLHPALCEVAHTSVEISKVLVNASPGLPWERPCIGGRHAENQHV
jgi:hypothetical protein